MTNTTALAHQLRATQRLAYRLEQAIEVLRPHFPLDPEQFDPDMLPVEVAMGLDAFRTRFAPFAAVTCRPTSYGACASSAPALMSKPGAAMWTSIWSSRARMRHSGLP